MREGEKEIDVGRLGMGGEAERENERETERERQRDRKRERKRE